MNLNPKSLLSLLFISLFLYCSTQAQASRHLRQFRFSDMIHESCSDMAMHPSEDLILAGRTGNCSPSTCDYGSAIVRVDPDGNIKWATRISNPTEALNALSVCTDPAGNIVMASQYNYTFQLTKLDASGNLMWMNDYFINPNLKPASIIAAHGAYFVTGNYNGNNGDGPFICRIESNGDVGWFKAYKEQDEFDQFSQIKLTSTGELVVSVSGSSPNYTTNTISLLFFDEHGNIQRSWHYQEPTDLLVSYISDVLPTSDGGYLLSLQGANGSYSMVLIKLNSTGSIEWSNQYAPGGSPAPSFCLWENPFGGYRIWGNHYPYSNNAYLFNMEVSAAGNCTSYSILDHPNHEYIISVVPTSGCDYYISGSGKAMGRYAWIFARADSSGTIGSETDTTLGTVTPISLQTGSRSIIEEPFTLMDSTSDLVVDVAPLVEDSVIFYETVPSCSSPVSVEVELDPNWKIGPNPAFNQLRIEKEGLPSTAMVRLFNAQGQIVIQRTIPTPNSLLDLSSLPSGAYWIQIVENGKPVLHQLLHKMR